MPASGPEREVARAAEPSVDELLKALVAFDTTSAKSNLKLIEFVRAHLDGLGVASTLTPSEDGTKASLLTTIGLASGGGIELSGHSDCVPVDGRSWSSDALPPT